jgi:Fis family transcriptional regulator, factor for inversion stimulation protein
VRWCSSTWAEPRGASGEALYSEALRVFKKQFILTVLRDLDWNETKAARALGMHRNTLARTLSQLDLDIRALRETKRRPLCGVDPPRQKKLAS